MRPNILVEKRSSSNRRFDFGLNLDLHLVLGGLRCSCCLAHLLVILHGGDLRESPSTELTTVRLLSCVTPHMALQTRGLEEPFSTLVAEMGALIVVLFPGWMDKHECPTSEKIVIF